MLKQFFILSCISSVFAFSLPVFAACEGNSNSEYTHDLLESVARAMVDSNMSAKANVSYCLSANRAFGPSQIILREGGRTCRISLVNLTIYRNSCNRSSSGDRSNNLQCLRRGGLCYSGAECCRGYCSSVMPGVGGYCL